MYQRRRIVKFLDIRRECVHDQRNTHNQNRDIFGNSWNILTADRAETNPTSRQCKGERPCRVVTWYHHVTGRGGLACEGQLWGGSAVWLSALSGEGAGSTTTTRTWLHKAVPTSSRLFIYLPFPNLDARKYTHILCDVSFWWCQQKREVWGVCSSLRQKCPCLKSQGRKLSCKLEPSFLTGAIPWPRSLCIQAVDTGLVCI